MGSRAFLNRLDAANRRLAFACQLLLPQGQDQNDVVSQPLVCDVVGRVAEFVVHSALQFSKAKGAAVDSLDPGLVVYIGTDSFVYPGSQKMTVTSSGVISVRCAMESMVDGVHKVRFVIVEQTESSHRSGHLAVGVMRSDTVFEGPNKNEIRRQADGSFQVRQQCKFESICCNAQHDFMTGPLVVRARQQELIKAGLGSGTMEMRGTTNSGSNG